MFRRVVPPAAAAVLAAVTGLGLSTPSHAGVQIVSQSCTVDHVTREAFFTLLLDAPPDFKTVDEYQRVRDSFQYEINTTWSGRYHDPKLDSFDVVVRGDELATTGSLPVRSADYLHPDPSPLSSGWGKILTTAPVIVDGAKLSFCVPLDQLGDFDGVFAYRVFTTEFGGTTSSIEAHVVPLPTSASAAGVAVAVLYAGNAARKRFRLSHRTERQDDL